MKNCSERQGVKDIIKKYKISNWKIRGAIHALTFEIVRKRNKIDEIIKYALNERCSFQEIEMPLKNMIRVGVYQIKIQEKIPAKITNEIVNIVKHKFNLQKSKFVNALLKKIENISLEDVEQHLPSKDEQLSFKYSHPVWYIKYLRDLMDEDSVIAFLKENNKVPPLYLRANTLKVPLDKIIDILKDKGVEIERDADFSEIIKVIKTDKPVTRIKSYKKGLFYIQTKASAVVVHSLNPQPDELIFDTCAAPGGKTTHIAQLMKNKGRIIAFELNLRRLKELKSKLSTLNIKNVDVIHADSKKLPIRSQADRVLVDPPCTGSGAYSSRPLSRWKIGKKSLRNFPKLQLNLLSAGAEHVKSGGILVYSTCSILIEEDEDIVKEFLKKHVNFKIIPASSKIGIKGYKNCEECVRLFPHLHETEGFFIAKFKKIDEK